MQVVAGLAGELTASFAVSRALPSYFAKNRELLTRIHPLHAIWKGVVRNQIVSSPSGI